MSTTYKVKSYIAFITPTKEAILQNNRGIIKIKNNDLIKFLLLINEKKIKEITLEYISTFISSPEAAIDFLLKYEVIERPSFYNFDIHKVRFISNNMAIGEKTSEVLKNTVENYEYTFSSNPSSFISSNMIDDLKTVWIVFMNPYSKNEAKKVRDLFLEKENQYLLIAYIYNNNFYVDSIYSAEWKTPCHLCQFSWVEAELRGFPSEGMNYQRLVEELYDESEDFEINLPTNSVQTINIVSQLSTRIIELIGAEKHLTSNQSTFAEGLVMNLKNFKTFTDSTVHWELCNCYE